MPPYALYRGRRCRVLGYQNGLFQILDSDDARRWVPRSRLTFL